MKKIIPFFVKQKIKYFLALRKTIDYYKYDYIRYLRHSNFFYRNDTQSKLLSLITAEYHAVEKGLTFKKPRLGFGLPLILDLISHCEEFVTKFNNRSEIVDHAISVIHEYYIYHIDQGYTFSEKYSVHLLRFLDENKCGPSRQKELTKSEFFKYNEDSFLLFSKSRHSLRHFEGKIDEENLSQAIQLANFAPSACNRQPTQVRVISDNEKIKDILKLQSGNRGFGDQFDKLLIITGEINSFLGLEERNDVYVNGGIFSMNLLYSLHYYRIGACTLNWCVSPATDSKLRRLITIKDSQVVILMIGCGNVPDSFKIATSPRKNKIIL